MNRIVGAPCWSKSESRPLGEVVDTGHGPHGFRVLVVTPEGQLLDCSAGDISLVEPGKESARRSSPPPLQPANVPPGTGTGNPGSIPPRLG